MRDRWKEAHDFVSDATRAFFGIQKSQPLPERTLPYSQKLLSDGRFVMSAGARWVPSQEWLLALADEYLPKLAAQGVRRVMPEPVSESDPTERGRICKLDGGIHGDLNVGSCCTTHRYRPAEFFGGMKAWRYFHDKAHALGLEAGVWVGAHMSNHAAIFEDHPDWLLRGFNTRPYAGGYPSHQLAVVNMNSPARQWILDDLKRWKDEGGIDYVWFDSMGNLALLPVDYSRDMESNAAGVAELIAGLEAIGIPTIEVEGVSPFGVSACYIMDADPATSGGVQWIAGQNCWEWYEGNEDMLVGQQPRAGVHESRSEENARRRFFRCLANQCVPEMARYAPPAGTGAAWYREMVDTYLAVEGEMAKRRLLPERQGVLWTRATTQVLFSFADFAFELPAGARVETIRGGIARPLACGGTLAAEPWTVYRVTV